MRLELGALGSNCYIIPAEGNKVIVVDPASTGEVEAVVESNDLEIGGLIVTHGHFDHFAGVAALKAVSGAPVYAPELDAEMLQSADKSWAWFMQGTEFSPVVPDRLFSDGDTFSVCGVDFRVMAAPGHTAGSCLLFCDKFGVIITGDVIFRGSIGRTDGFSGSGRMMAESLQRIRGIQGNYILLCGHGDPSDLDTEKRTNPYLSETDGL